MRLLAISDLHVAHQANREALRAIEPAPDDWLILGGDLAERREDLRWVFDLLAPRFRQLIWVPGNHELWTCTEEPDLKGEAKYLSLVSLCREYGVLTPEDPFPVFPADGEDITICPLFLLYDYSFCPDGMSPAQALEWAREAELVCTDEFRLSAAPRDGVVSWCRDRVAYSRRRLEAVAGRPTVLVNHYPLRRDLAVLPRIPRFSIWCGTRQTDDWHRRFNAKAVIYGHLHIPRTSHRDGVRFEEVSFGYPRERQGLSCTINDRIRRIL